jgi:TRAP-type C4-dicarboxylate transport system permease small subunit
MAIVVQGIVAVFAGTVLVYGGYVLVSETLRAGQVTSALGIRQGHVYLAVPISGAFLLLFCLERIVELILGRAGDDSDAPRMDSAADGSKETQPAE